MLVKICGIQTIEAAQAAVLAGADWIGFVFAPSKRRVSLEQARAIATTLPPSIQTVGVFVNETVETMNGLASKVPLDYIQLHGQEDNLIAKKIEAKIMKAFSITEIKQADAANYPCDYILVDAPRATYAGGNGVVFDWQQLKNLQLPHDKLMIAGGLTPDNVTSAIRLLQPTAVDVSSGVETNGKKDHNKITQFINRAKRKG